MGKLFGAVFVVAFWTVVAVEVYQNHRLVPLYDLNLRWGQKVVMDDVFYGHCEGTVVSRTFDMSDIPHYWVDLQCRSVPITHMDWTVYKIRKYAP